MKFKAGLACFYSCLGTSLKLSRVLQTSHGQSSCKARQGKARQGKRKVVRRPVTKNAIAIDSKLFGSSS